MSFFVFLIYIVIETNIINFLKFYRHSFPKATVLPKMHTLEDHVVPWVRRWRLGSGLMGEQGAESIHAHIMKLERIHQGILDDVERLRYIMKEHVLESDPSLTCLIPAPKKRGKKTDDSSEDDSSGSDTDS